MAGKKVRSDKYEAKKREFSTMLKVGDTVMVLAGGNSVKEKKLKGEIGKILKLLPKRHRVVVEGINMIKRHKRAATAADAAGIITKEGSVHISNVQFYSEQFKRPVRLGTKVLDDGKKVRHVSARPASSPRSASPRCQEPWQRRSGTDSPIARGPPRGSALG